MQARYGSRFFKGSRLLGWDEASSNVRALVARFALILLPALGGGAALASAETPPNMADRAADSTTWQKVTNKHSGSGLVLQYTVPDKIAIGETVTLQLRVGGVSAPDGATVEVRDRSTRTLLLFERLTPGDPRTLQVPFTARVDGMQFVVVTTVQQGRGTVQTIPLRVGSGSVRLKVEGERRATTGGEDVISLPAATASAPGAAR